MTKTSLYILIAFGLLMLTIACSRPVCKNTNPIFDRYSPESKVYKDELVKQLKKADISRLTYRMDTYQKENNSEYIQAHIQGEGLCAKLVLVVKDADKGIEGILKNKGIGYRGAELKDLQFDIYQVGSKTEFIFKEISGIID